LSINRKFIMSILKNKFLLYIGLFFLFVAFIGRHLGVSKLYCIPIFCIAILLKIIFLFNVFRSIDFKMSLWLMLILVGVCMILLSLLFKFALPVLWLRNLLFYGAIALKATGLIIKIKSSITH